MLQNKKIQSVKPGSIADIAGIKDDEILLRVNGQDFNDTIDLSFLFADCDLRLTILDKCGQERLVNIQKDIDQDVGLVFSTAVFDGIRCCHNKCVFCFVEQMAPKMRDSLYIRDDDYRLSFLFGNFITLTNLTDADKKRIVQYNLSPLYVSIHATDPAVRKFLLKNPKACNIFQDIKDLASYGIQFHAQVVLCPGINDGKILDKTVEDLLYLQDSILSLAVVPVGLTKYCKNLDNILRSFTKNEAKNIVQRIDRWQKTCRDKFGRSFIYAADEFYVQADIPFPEAEFYDGFMQYENGVGICRKFINEWYEQKADFSNAKQEYCIICGQSGAKVIQSLLNESKLNHQLLVVDNEFFGNSVTVTGLLTGNDIIQAINNLPNKPCEIILPSVMLRDDNLFLDDMSLEKFIEKVQANIHIVHDAVELKKLLTK